MQYKSCAVVLHYGQCQKSGSIGWRLPQNGRLTPLLGDIFCIEIPLWKNNLSDTQLIVFTNISPKLFSVCTQSQLDSLPLIILRQSKNLKLLVYLLL